MLNRVDVLRELEAERIRAGEAREHFAFLLLRVQRHREEHQLFGDFLSAAARTRVRAALRPQDRILPVGDNVFALLLPNLRDSGHALLAANRLVRAFREPLLVGDRLQQGVPTIGIAMYPEHGDHAEDLCRAAEQAFAQALTSRDRYQLFQPENARTEPPYVDLREAIINNRLEVFLQPLWDIRAGKVIGAESLARWHSDVHGAISPIDFVLLAEQTGLIESLTRWSVNTTLRHCASARAAGHRLRYSINLSPRVFHEPGLVEQFQNALAIWDVPAEDVVLEVTESAVMEDPSLSAVVLGQLREIGFGISIDDFGIGYSSFAYLKRFPATELKIDQEFVLDIGVNPRAARLVHSMIDLAHHLDLVAVAEGVEDEATLERLRDMGCDLAQGFLFGRPQPAAKFIATLASPA
ncbi:MAG TPA: GGDEF domain-containing phosphodiesterase [Patescibacteria group bacterium]|nr:GGDEF domain-containing phosphodiesterase [Patescibacteria group bacterium]